MCYKPQTYQNIIHKISQEEMENKNNIFIAVLTILFVGFHEF